MPAVFVHGVPDTAELWTPLLARLSRDDTIALRLPGFGEPVPAGFGSTKDEYAAWVADQIRAVGEPVDLVGHDWGSLLTQRVATSQPELVRTWTLADGAVTETFQWHELAKQWQTPEVGEQVMELMSGDALGAGLADAGHPDGAACAARIDDAMKRSILALYRSAVDVASEWGPGLDASTRPALVLWGEHDRYGPVANGRRVAERIGARLVVLDGGHWAILERPDETARALTSFWSGD